MFTESLESYIALSVVNPGENFVVYIEPQVSLDSPPASYDYGQA